MNGHGTPPGGNGHTEPFARVTRRLIGEQLWRLPKTDILVHLFITSYADKHSGEAFPGVETIAEGVHCSRESVSRSTARLRAAGLLKKKPRRAGRGGWAGTLYTVVAEPIGEAGICDETVTHVCDETVTQYVTKPSPDLDHLSDHKIKEPPYGAHAHTREGGEDVFDGDRQEVDRAQTSLLLPMPSGDRARAARLALIKSYNPSPGLVDWAAQRAVNACSDDVLGRWRDTRIRDNKLPRDLEEADADFRLWIRNEPHVRAEREARAVPRRRGDYTSPLEDAAAANTFEQIKGMWAPGRHGG